MYNLTVEQMTANAEAYQAQLDEATAALKSLTRPSREWATSWRKKNNAKAMLEEYLGWTEHSGEFIEDSIAPDGSSIGHWENEIFHKGVIQKKLEEAERLSEESNLGERFRGRTFASFDAKRDREAFGICSKYANDPKLMERKRNSLLLVGDYGTGKTHLAAAISNALIGRGIPVLFGTFGTHLENLRQEIDHAQQKTYLSKMKVTPMLVIDDLGKEKKSEWTKQVLFDVINYRYEHLLPTIITTNLASADNFDDLANHVEGAVYSRLNEMCHTVVTKGEDYRRGK